MLYTQTGINCDKLSEIDQCPKYPSHMELSPVPLMPPNKQHLPLVQESRDFLTLLPPSISSLFSGSINPNCCILCTICHSSLTAQLICMLSGDVSCWHASRTVLIHTFSSLISTTHPRSSYFPFLRPTHWFRGWGEPTVTTKIPCL